MATCFNTSPVFRHQILRLLYDTCRIKRRVVDAAWQCATEVQTPTAGGGRLDLRFGGESSGRSSRTPVFVIENKVEAKLTLKQLRKYRKHDVKYLIAVTKYPPDVPEQLMKREGIFALRWQDIHRYLSANLPSAGPVDRFLIRSFLTYLEDLKMAYPEQLKVADLNQLRKALNVAVSVRRYKGIDPKGAFATADLCLGFLEELRRQLVDKIPELEPFKHWGPMFYASREDKDEPVKNAHHGFAWQIQGRPWYVLSFGCGFCFPRSLREPTVWAIWLERRGRRTRETTYRLSKFSDATGTIRQDAMLRMLMSFARKWRVGKTIKKVSKRRKRR
jgi:hypothetical protein